MQKDSVTDLIELHITPFYQYSQSLPKKISTGEGIIRSSSAVRNTQFAQPVLYFVLLGLLAALLRGRSGHFGFPRSPRHHMQVPEGVDHQKHWHGGDRQEVQKTVQHAKEFLKFEWNIFLNDLFFKLNKSYSNWIRWTFSVLEIFRWAKSGPILHNCLFAVFMSGLFHRWCI